MIGNNSERKRYLNTFLQKQVEDIKKVDIDIFSEGSKKEKYSVYTLEEITKGSPISLYKQNGLSTQFRISLDSDVEYIWVDREKHILPAKYITRISWDKETGNYRNVKPEATVSYSAMIPPNLMEEAVGSNAPRKESTFSVTNDRGNLVLRRSSILDTTFRRIRLAYMGVSGSVPVQGYLDHSTKNEQIIKARNVNACITVYFYVSANLGNGEWSEWQLAPISYEYISNGYNMETVPVEEGETPDLVLANISFDEPKAHNLIVHTVDGEDIIYQFYIKETIKEKTVGLDIPVVSYRDALLNVTKLWLLSSKFDRIRNPDWAGFFDDRCQRFPMTEEGTEKLKTELKKAIEDKIEDVIITDVYAKPNLEERGWEVGVTSIDTATRIMVEDAKASGAVVNYTLESQERLR